MGQSYLFWSRGRSSQKAEAGPREREGDNLLSKETRKAYTLLDLLKELREAAEEGKACALPTATSDGSTACQEHRIARGKQLQGWEVRRSCELCHLAHIWLTQLDHLVQMFYFTA